MEKGKDYYGVSTKDGQKYLIKVLETTGLMGDCNVFLGETLIAKGYTMFVGGNFMRAGNASFTQHISQWYGGKYIPLGYGLDGPAKSHRSVTPL